MQLFTGNFHTVCFHYIIDEAYNGVIMWSGLVFFFSTLS